MHTLSLKVSDHLYQQINAATTEQGIQKSSLIRRALERYFAELPMQQGSFLELAQDLCGAVKGPSDLSSHSKHMEGYGK